MIEGATALEEERKKNLSILQSVLGGRQHSNSATAGKAKNFRWVRPACLCSGVHVCVNLNKHVCLQRCFSSALRPHQRGAHGAGDQDHCDQGKVPAQASSSPSVSGGNESDPKLKTVPCASWQPTQKRQPVWASLAHTPKRVAREGRRVCEVSSPMMECPLRNPPKSGKGPHKPSKTQESLVLTLFLFL